MLLSEGADVEVLSMSLLYIEGQLHKPITIAAGCADIGQLEMILNKGQEEGVQYESKTIGFVEQALSYSADEGDVEECRLLLIKYGVLEK